MFYQNDIVENNLIKYMKGTDLYEKLLEYKNYFIFGGAIRDAFINRDNCVDIDILCIDGKLDLPNSLLIEDSTSISNQHKGIAIAGFKQEYPNGLIVDIMYPSNIKDRNITGLFSTINDVDITTSGIAYNHISKFIEVVPNSIEYCKRKIFSVREYAEGYSHKTEKRIENLINLGFFRIN